MTGAVIWLVIVIVLGLVEISTMSLVSIWFVFGAVGAMTASLLGARLPVQLVVFIIVSVILLALTRPFVRKFLRVKETRTNADRIIGEKALVIQRIDNLVPTGQVKVMGQVWTARSDDDVIIETGEMVRVLSISGVKLIVHKMGE